MAKSIKKKQKEKAKHTILKFVTGKVIAIGLIAGVLILAVLLYFTMLKQQTDIMLSTIAGWFTTYDDDEELDEEMVYQVNIDIGVDGCILRPQTGIYPESGAAGGLGTSRGDLPAGVPTIQELIAKDKEKYCDKSPGTPTSVYEKSHNGATKTMMGWQKLSHLEGGKIDFEYADQYKFIAGVYSGTHTYEEAKKAKFNQVEEMNKNTDNKFFDSLGFGYVNDRYVVAVKQELGTMVWGEQTKVGDAIDIYLNDGQIIKAWVGDEKRQMDKDASGKEYTSDLVHLDGSIVEFIVNKKIWYGSDNGKGNLSVKGVKPDFGNPEIVGIVKVGNWWENGGAIGDAVGGTGTEVGETGMAYLDENGEPCDPEGGETCSATGSWEDNFGAEPGRRTYRNLIATACSAMGRSYYLWGGSHTKHMGITEEQLGYYKERHDTDTAGPTNNSSASWKDAKGFDCSGFVSWVCYNTLYKNIDEASAWTEIYSGSTGPFVQDLGVGTSFWATSTRGDLKPGDMLGGGGHIIMVVGKEDDGSTVLIEASGGATCIRLTGSDGKAIEVAKKYNDVINSVASPIMGDNWFPEGNARDNGPTSDRGKFRRGSEKTSPNGALPRTYRNNGRWTTGPEGLEDPDGILNMTADQILGLIIGDGKGNGSGGSCTEGSGLGTGKTIYLDPGHGASYSDSTDSGTLTAQGYVQNSDGKWGTWRHFGSSGQIGTDCNGCGKDSSHNCWYPLGNGMRDVSKEPTITYGICEKVKTKLESEGFKVVMSRTRDEHPSIQKRAADASAAGADIQLCIHSNAGGGSGYAYCDPSINGVAGYGANSYKGGDWLSKSTDLNKKLLQGLQSTIPSDKMGLYSGGVIKNYGYLVLYERATCPTAYMEIGFFDKENELAYLLSEEGQNQIADGIVKGVKSYYGM